MKKACKQGHWLSLISLLLYLQGFEVQGQKHKFISGLGIGFIHGETIGTGLISDDIGFASEFHYAYGLIPRKSFLIMGLSYFQANLDRSEIQDKSFYLYQANCAISSLSIGVKSYPQLNNRHRVFQPFIGISSGIDLLSVRIEPGSELPKHLYSLDRMHKLAFVEWQIGMSFTSRSDWNVELYTNLHTNFTDDLDGIYAYSNGRIDILYKVGFALCRNFN